MIRSLRWMLTLLSLVLLLSCASEDVGQGPPYQEVPLRITYRDWQQQEGDCGVGGSQTCATVRLRYPTAQGGSPVLCESLNAYVHSYLLQAFEGIMPDRPAQTSIDSVIQAFFDDYHRHQAVFSDTALPWGLEIDGEVIYQSDQWLTLRMVHREYLGDAAPQQWTRYLMLDCASGRTLSPSDLVEDPTQLQKLVETRLRHQLGLPASRSLLSVGFNLPAGPYPFLENFGLTKQGLVVHYNAYEVAPQQLGSVEVKIPLSELAAYGLP
jgi:hypothetical protein